MVGDDVKHVKKAKEGISNGLWKKNYNSAPLAESFDAFIDWKKRRQGENGFLANVLRTYGAKNVLDAGMGTACDAIYLKKEGFEVVGNEVDPAFRKVARSNFRKEGVALPVTAYEWRKLGQGFGAGKFDAVLLLGNSLTYVFGREAQVEAVANFCKVLKDGGLLLMDERNYPKIMRMKKDILEGRPFCTGKYVYCGTKARNYPVKIEKDEVVFEYVHDSGQRAYLAVYPFRKGEMNCIIRAAGFGSVAGYSDFRPGYDTGADFHQHLAIK